MALISITLNDIWPTFQGHDNIQCPITRLIVSRRIWYTQCFRFQWPWMIVNLDFKVIIDALGILCAQLTRDLFAIAKFLFVLLVHHNNLGKMVACTCIFALFSSRSSEMDRLYHSEGKCCGKIQWRRSVYDKKSQCYEQHWIIRRGKSEAEVTIIKDCARDIVMLKVTADGWTQRMARPACE